MHSTPVAKDLCEKDLCEIIDALEAGLLRLREERDRLRNAAEQASAAPATPPAAPRRAPAKKAARKAAKKAVKKAPKKKAVNPVEEKETHAPEPVVPASKAPSKSRPALGRTLTMIRSPRVQNP